MNRTPSPGTPPPRSLGGFVAERAAAGQLVVQPRMGFSDPVAMRRGLERTKFAAATTVGTLTLDSYTRLGEHEAARRAMAEGTALNGYPLVTHDPRVTRAVLAGLLDASFPVQVRHGSAKPQQIIKTLTSLGLDATEGGPVSYCLPYGRTPLRESVDAWRESCELLAGLVGPGRAAHLESFGGCMLGQLCPPSLLVALSVLEALFFTRHGLRSVSLSYAQQTDRALDEEAIRALRRLAGALLPPDTEWHVVLYTYMGVFPSSARGARALLEAAAGLAVATGAQRLIVKTVTEAHRIPRIEDNVRALELAAAAATAQRPAKAPADEDGVVYTQARALVEAVLELDDDLGRALVAAFERGYLDVPYCLHPDNAGRSRSFLDDRGRLRWASVGRMPIAADTAPSRADRMTPDRLLHALTTVARTYDR
jgi:methylaspartate mutase epsilon subunit